MTPDLATALTTVPHSPLLFIAQMALLTGVVMGIGQFLRSLKMIP